VVEKDGREKKDPSDTTKWYRVMQHPGDSNSGGSQETEEAEEEGEGGYAGRLGFITSMSR
jgi:hypothetical protein